MRTLPVGGVVAGGGLDDGAESVADDGGGFVLTTSTSVILMSSTNSSRPLIDVKIKAGFSNRMRNSTRAFSCSTMLMYVAEVSIIVPSSDALATSISLISIIVTSPVVIEAALAISTAYPIEWLRI